MKSLIRSPASRKDLCRKNWFEKVEELLKGPKVEKPRKVETSHPTTQTMFVTCSCMGDNLIRVQFIFNAVTLCRGEIRSDKRIHQLWDHISCDHRFYICMSVSICHPRTNKLLDTSPFPTLHTYLSQLRLKPHQDRVLVIRSLLYSPLRP